MTAPAEVTKFDSGDGATVGGAHPADNISINTVVGRMTDIFPHAHPVESSLNKEELKLLKCGVSGVAKINLQVMQSAKEDFTEKVLVQVMVGGGNGPCEMEMNGALIVEYMVAVFSKSTFL